MLAFILASSATIAQEYNFRNISVADGLAQSQVYAMCQDHRGVIWFGTRGGGVSCYDGVSFRGFSEEEGRAGNYVRGLVEDRSGAIWVGTDQGVVRYDGRIFSRPRGSVGGNSIVVNALAVDSAGVLWVGSERGGLWRRQGDSLVAVPWIGDLPSPRVRCLFTDARGRLWIGTDRGVTVREGERLVTYMAGDGLPREPVSAIAQDRSGAIWIGTYGGGAARLGGADVVLFTAGDGLPNNTITSLLVDRVGRLWIGTAGGGVCRRGDSGCTVFTETEGLCNNVVMSLLEDAEGNIWIGSSGGGVSRYDGERLIHFTERQGKIGNWVYAICEDSAGTVWIGNSAGGVTSYDGASYARYTGRQHFTSGKVKCIFEDSRGVLWFGTVGDGLFIREGGSFRRVVWSGSRARFINALAEDGAGNIWLASSDAGVICIPSETGGTTGGVLHIGHDGGLGTDRAYDILAGRDGAIWVATDGAGIARIIPRDSGAPEVTRFTVQDGLGSNTVRSVARDSAGNLLFGTAGGGLIVHAGGRFRNIGRKQGLRSNNIYALVVDGGGDVWLGTEKGIDRIRIDREFRAHELKHYGRAEGIRGIETSQNAGCVDHRGNIWFGTIRGAVRYNPREDRPNGVPPRTHLKEVRLFFDPIETTPFADSVAAWYPIPVALELPYDQNHLGFEFVGISHRNPDAVTYQWMLDGFDGGWSPRSTQSTAVYSNLPPGSYTFRVRSFNEDGVADSSLTGFSFVIDPPFWGTWWFRTALGCVVVLGVGTAFAARLAKIRRENERERHELEMRRSIVELEQKSLRLSMNPHFIFNALNSIQSFIGERETLAARRYLSKFARLMRLILENSRTGHVSIEDEMAMLASYLELERLNLGGRFDYTVKIAPDLDPSAVLIPPMLIQPLVENAVVHGVRCMESGGMIRVMIEVHGDLVHCTVSDNGIGRERAAAIRAGSGKRESTALAVIRERLAIMSRQRNMEAGLEVTDLLDDRGAPAGTRCDLFVPYVDA